jgi:hypothetical protein
MDLNKNLASVRPQSDERRILVDRCLYGRTGGCIVTGKAGHIKLLPMTV